MAVTNGSPKERDDDGNDDPPGQQLAKPDLTKEEQSLVKIPTNEASIAAPDAPNADLRTEVCPVTEVASVLVGDVVLVLSAPLEPCRLIKLHRWLREVVRADVGETAGSWSKDTVLKITLRRPTPLLKMLNESPDIKDVIIESPIDKNMDEIDNAVHRVGGTMATGAGYTRPNRFRLTLAAA